ncbi:MAG: NAD-dependent deacylase [Synergistaceae bacterium]|jgi:NAD-dependent deacetylase|nr:NAD-dependent deacylase [Synergistaceae bacterium]
MKDDMAGLKIVADRMTAPGAKTVVFTGAGMSTDSGLPDFRSKGGVWSKVNPMELATATAMRQNYDVFHEFYSQRFVQMREAAPNEGHRILADWEGRGLVRCIITQNIDGLHAAAGSREIYELHGSVGKVRCMECGNPSTQEDFISRQPCRQCNGRLRPGVVLFEEGLPSDAFESSRRESEKSSVFIVLGSSLQVYPANQMPEIAKMSGAVLAICNRDITPLDGMADYRTNDGISDFLRSLDSLIGH